jgi:hypothetical protein
MALVCHEILLSCNRSIENTDMLANIFEAGKKRDIQWKVHMTEKIIRLTSQVFFHNDGVCCIGNNHAEGRNKIARIESIFRYHTSVGQLRHT